MKCTCVNSFFGIYECTPNDCMKEIENKCHETMITLKEETAKLIKDEMESIPEKYQKPFNSVHEGLAVLREEYIELENEIFFGEKKAKNDFIEPQYPIDRQIEHEKLFTNGDEHLWKHRIKTEAIQVAAMACRIIQELT